MAKNTLKAKFHTHTTSMGKLIGQKVSICKNLQIGEAEVQLFKVERTNLVIIKQARKTGIINDVKVVTNVKASKEELEKYQKQDESLDLIPFFRRFYTENQQKYGFPLTTNSLAEGSNALQVQSNDFIYTVTKQILVNKKKREMYPVEELKKRADDVEYLESIKMTLLGINFIRKSAGLPEIETLLSE